MPFLELTALLARTLSIGPHLVYLSAQRTTCTLLHMSPRKRPPPREPEVGPKRSSARSNLLPKMVHTTAAAALVEKDPSHSANESHKSKFNLSKRAKKDSDGVESTSKQSKVAKVEEKSSAKANERAAKGVKYVETNGESSVIVAAEEEPNGVNSDAELVSPIKKRSGKATPKDDDTPRSLSAPPPGGSKMDTFADPAIPKNMTIEDPLKLDNTPPKSGTSRIASWNILSLKSSLSKGFQRYIDAEQADVVILTETKCNDVPMVPSLSATYPFQTWGIGEKKGYAGIAVLSKKKPIKITTGIPGWSVDTKGRIITAEYDNYIVIGTYVVNAGEGLKTLPQKQEWNNRFAEHLARCDARKPTIWTGDLNVVLDARDLSNASKKWDKSAGYTKIECEHHRKVLAGTACEGAKPYLDIWRELHPDAVGHYTYYGFRGMCRSKGIGWRLDSFIVPERIKSQITACEIRHTIYGASDHLPIYLDIQGNL